MTKNKKHSIVKHSIVLHGILLALAASIVVILILSITEVISENTGYQITVGILIVSIVVTVGGILTAPGMPEEDLEI